jgi:hypothetical protein
MVVLQVLSLSSSSSCLHESITSTSTMRDAGTHQYC